MQDNRQPNPVPNTATSTSDRVYRAVCDSADWLSARVEAPRIAIVLGSGLGSFADSLSDAQRFAYEDIPGFPSVGVDGHTGELVVGRLGEGGCRVAALSGRSHLYEGYDTDRVVHAVRTLHHWGVAALLVTNASGGLNPAHDPGDLMLIDDHINMTGRNPLCGPNDPRFGPRFPDMSHAYDPALGEIVMQCSGSMRRRTLRRGVYVGVLGPSYETPAEIRMLRQLGGDAVGMSTVNEVIAARHVGLRVVGMSCITNLAAGLTEGPITHDEVKETAAYSRADFIGLLTATVPRIDAAIAAGT